MRKGFRRLMLVLLALCLVVVVSFFCLRSKYRLTIRDLAETSGKNATTDLANDANAKDI